MDTRSEFSAVLTLQLCYGSHCGERLGSGLGIAIAIFCPWGPFCAARSFRALSRDSQLKFSRPALSMSDCQVLCLGGVADCHCAALFPSNLYQQVPTPQGGR